MSVRGIVLAGGFSRRMGTDKAQLVWQGQTLLERAVDLLLPLCGDVVIASSMAAHVHPLAQRVAEPEPGQGPLGAVLAAAGPEWSLVVPVDMPLLEGVTLARMLAARTMGMDGVVYGATEGRLAPLPGLFHGRALGAAHALWEEGGRSLQAWIRRISHRILPVEDAREFTNFNTPEQWHQLIQAP